MNMRRLTSGIFLFGALTSSAFATDDLQPNDALAASTYDWSGIYAGLGLTASRFSDTDTLFPGFESSGDGANATAFAGINFQLDSWVFGVEADYSRPNADFDVLPAGYQSVEITEMASVRARIGFAVDKVMLYGTAGLGYAQADVTAFTGLAAPVTVTTELDGFGAVYGLGIDYAITNNVVIGLQYQHQDYNDFGKGNTLPGQVIDAKFDSITARVIFKF